MPPEGIAGLIDRFTGIRPGDEVLVLSSRRGRSKVEKPQDGTLRGRTPASLLRRPPKAGSYDLIVSTEVAKQIGPERFLEACSSLYRALRPGGELLIRLDLEPPATPSATTALACLLLAGFEVIDSAPTATSLDCRLIRPLDLDDIQKFFRNG